MGKIKLLLTLIILGFVMVIISCSNEDENDLQNQEPSASSINLVGNWYSEFTDEGPGYYFHEECLLKLKSDGTFEYQEYDLELGIETGRWELEPTTKILRLYFIDGSEVEVEDYLIVSYTSTQIIVSEDGDMDDMEVWSKTDMESLMPGGGENAGAVDIVGNWYSEITDEGSDYYYHEKYLLKLKSDGTFEYQEYDLDDLYPDIETGRYEFNSATKVLRLFFIDGSGVEMEDWLIVSTSSAQLIISEDGDMDELEVWTRTDMESLN